MRQLLDTVWQRRGASWVWDEEARNQICAASEVWSLRQFLRASKAPGNWPDDLPSNGGKTLVVAGLEGSLEHLDGLVRVCVPTHEHVERGITRLWPAVDADVAL